MKQGTQEWIDARKGKLTASRVGSILGHNPYATRDDVMREMVREWAGVAREFTGNIATRWGTKHEPDALAALSHEVEACGLIQHPEYEFLAASPDGLVGVSALVETKCPFGLRNDEAPEFKEIAQLPHYYDQIQLQLECTGRTICYFLQWTPNAHITELVSANPNWLANNIDELKTFHDEFRMIVESEELFNLYLEDLVLDLSLDRDFAEIEADYKMAWVAAEAAAKALKDKKQILVDYTAGRKAKGSQYLVYSTTRKGSVSYAKAVNDLLPDADLSKYTGKPSTSWAVKKVAE